MPLTCADISASVALDCNNLPIPGTDEVVYLGNWGERATAPVAGNIHTNLTLTVGANLYKVSGSNQSLVPSSALQNTGVAAGHIHTVQTIWPSLVAAELDELNKLVLGRVFAIVTKFTAGDPKFFVFGWSNGMRPNEMPWEMNSEDTDGLPQVTLQTLPGFKEPYIPKELLVTDYASTLALLETLVATGQA